jgi:3-phenylpropionate/trans-cinnamate dioxygenase ferredoxin reductase component
VTGGRAPERIVVVGGGLAGHTAVTSLRSEGYTGMLRLLNEEEYLPYDRPPLSKEVLAGRQDVAPFLDNYDELDIEVVLDCKVQKLATETLLTTCGRVPFDRLIAATGSTPARLSRSYPANTFELRTMADATRLRQALSTGPRVVVVGAGWLGGEVATVAAAGGCDVTVVDSASTPLARALPTLIGGLTIPWYGQHGIELRLNSPIQHLGPTGVKLASGERLPADVTVIAIGARPATGWLEGSGVRLDPYGAVPVSPLLQTSQPDVFAAGDIISWQSARFGTELRLEHWDNAVSSAAAAARNVLGAAESYDPVPYFWSDQLSRRIQYVGSHAKDDRLIFRGDPEEDDSWTVLWLRDNVIQGAFAVNCTRDIGDARSLIRRQAHIEAADAARASTRLRDAQKA